MPSENLLSLGAGNGSKTESVKASSSALRGTLREELTQPTDAFTETSAQLLKFHGSYQQEDRDQRRARREEGGGKAYQFMVRTRIPGGVVTSEQYLIEDELARLYGNGTLRITTRQGFQLHGVIKGNLQAAIARINAAGLTTLAACGDVNRNVMTCPRRTKTAAERAAQATAREIAKHLAPRTGAYREIWIDGEKLSNTNAPEEEPIYGKTYLPRKFKIGIALPDDNCIDVYTQDIGLVADIEGDELRGFTVLVGGGMGMTHGKKETYPRLGTPLCFVTPQDVLPVVEAIVGTFRDWGDRSNRKHARFKYVVEERGIEWVRADVERRIGRPLAFARKVTFDGADDHLGWHAQGDGRWALGIFVENGRIKDAPKQRLRTALRKVIDCFRPGIRLTGQQNILLTDVRPEQLAEIASIFASHGIRIDPREHGILRHTMACPALPTCGLALTDAERVLPSVVAKIAADMEQLGIAGRPLSIRMTGCPNGCARPYMGDIGFVGRSKDLYDIFIGGDWANTRLNWVYASAVPLSELAARVAPLLRRWRDEAADAESFGDFYHRLQSERAALSA